MKAKKLADTVKLLRSNRGISQEFLAEEAKVSLRTIQRIENEESFPTGETIKRIAVALDVSINELINLDSRTEKINLTNTILFLKAKRSKTSIKTEIKTFDSFIAILTHLKEKNLNTKQLESIESYLYYLELEKIPSFSNDIFKKKLKKFKTYLKTKLRFVPNNYYFSLALIFAVPFTVTFSIQPKIETSIRITVISIAILVVIVAVLFDSKIKKEGRSLRF